MILIFKKIIFLFISSQIFKYFNKIVHIIILMMQKELYSELYLAKFSDISRSFYILYSYHYILLKMIINAFLYELNEQLNKTKNHQS